MGLLFKLRIMEKELYKLQVGMHARKMNME